MEYISLKKATKILDKEKKPLSSGYLGLLIRQGKLRAVKIGAKWFTKKEWLEEFRKKDLTSKTLHRKPSKERGFILPLYFGYGLKIALVKLTSNALNLTSKIFRRWWQEAVVLVLLVVLISSGFLFFQNVKNILAATFEWIQTDWSGGANTVDFPAHPADKAGWTIYYSKDTNIIAGTELTLTVTSASVTQNSYDVFNAGTKDDVYVSGGNVYLQKPLGKTCSAAIECVSGYCVDGVCCNSICGGTCQACNLTGNIGTCTTRSADDNTECGTCQKCDGSNTSCQNITSGQEGKNCTAACTECNGSGSCVNIANDTQDNVGSNLCNQICKKCSDGNCVNQSSAQDLFGQCDLISCGVILNAASGKSCTTKCAGYSGNSGLCNGAGACASSGACGCLSIGNDSGGTNGYIYMYGGMCTNWGGYTCTTTISDQGYADTCQGIHTWWTYCNCGL